MKKLFISPDQKKDISLYTASPPGLFSLRIRSWFGLLTQSILVRSPLRKVIMGGTF